MISQNKLFVRISAYEESVGPADIAIVMMVRAISLASRSRSIL